MDHLLDQDTDLKLIAALRRLDAAQSVAKELGAREAVEAAADVLERAVWGGEGRAA